MERNWIHQNPSVTHRVIRFFGGTYYDYDTKVSWHYKGEWKKYFKKSKQIKNDNI
jgi:hypothetical protein